MENLPDKLGAIVKEARLQTGMTRKEFAVKAQITPRHLLNIENNNQKPSYDVLFRLIRALCIPADWIFYPDQPHERRELEQAETMLRRCDDKQLKVITATMSALLD